MHTQKEYEKYESYAELSEEQLDGAIDAWAREIMTAYYPDFGDPADLLDVGDVMMQEYKDYYTWCQQYRPDLLADDDTDW